MDHFNFFRSERQKLLINIDYVMEVLKKGADKARRTASATKAEVWEKVGLKL